MVQRWGRETGEQVRSQGRILEVKNDLGNLTGTFGQCKGMAGLFGDGPGLWGVKDPRKGLCTLPTLAGMDVGWRESQALTPWASNGERASEE